MSFPVWAGPLASIGSGIELQNGDATKHSFAGAEAIGLALACNRVMPFTEGPVDASALRLATAGDRGEVGRTQRVWCAGCR